jgi:ribose transport system substrate-binding protein
MALSEPKHVHSTQAAGSKRAGDTKENRSVVRACDILKCFESARDPLGLAEVADRTALSKPTAYRILSTLVTEGMIQRLAKNTYAPAFLSAQRKTYRIGFA